MYHEYIKAKVKIVLIIALIMAVIISRPLKGMTVATNLWVAIKHNIPADVYVVIESISGMILQLNYSKIRYLYHQNDKLGT